MDVWSREIHIKNMIFLCFNYNLHIFISSLSLIAAIRVIFIVYYITFHWKYNREWTDMGKIICFISSNMILICFTYMHFNCVDIDSSIRIVWVKKNLFSTIKNKKGGLIITTKLLIGLCAQSSIDRLLCISSLA